MKNYPVPHLPVLLKAETVRRLASISLLLVTLAVAGCGKHVQQGQIFLTTRGGNSVKLGAVEILAFDEATVKALIKQRQAEIARQRDELKRGVTAAQQGPQNIAESTKKSVAEFHDAQAQYNQQDALVRRMKRELEPVNRKYRLIASQVLEASNAIAQADQRATYVRTNAEAQHQNDDEATRKLFLKSAEQDAKMAMADKQNQQANLDALLPKYEELKQQVAEKSSALEQEQQKLQSLATDLQEKRKIEKDAEDRQVEADRGLSDARQALAGMDVTGILFKDMPAPAARAVSDSDGKFRLELPSGGRFAVYAHAQRTVMQSENYFWLIWTGAKGDLLLNDANLFGSGSSDQVVSAELR